MVPTPGRIVHYRLSEADAAAVNKRRQDANRCARKHLDDADGTIIHTGNPAKAGDIYPMIITRVWTDTPTEADCVQGQVFLDGNDTLWTTSVQQQGHTYDPSITEGVWFEPARS